MLNQTQHPNLEAYKLKLNIITISSCNVVNVQCECPFWDFDFRTILFLFINIIFKYFYLYKIYYISNSYSFSSIVLPICMTNADGDDCTRHITWPRPRLRLRKGAVSVNVPMAKNTNNGSMMRSARAH